MTPDRAGSAAFLAQLMGGALNRRHEALIAAFIVAIVATFSLPSLWDGLRAHSLASATRAATNYLRLVRATAVARHKPTRLAVTGGDQLAIDVYVANTWSRAGNPLVLEGGVVVAQVTPGTGIVFESEGTSSAAGSVRLRNPRGDERVISVSILGAVEAPS